MVTLLPLSNPLPLSVLGSLQALYKLHRVKVSQSRLKGNVDLEKFGGPPRTLATILKQSWLPGFLETLALEPKTTPLHRSSNFEKEVVLDAGK